MGDARVTDKTLEIACRIPSDGTTTENTIHDLSLDLRDARARIKTLEATLKQYNGQMTIGTPHGEDGLSAVALHHESWRRIFEDVLDGKLDALPPR